MQPTSFRRQRDREDDVVDAFVDLGFDDLDGSGGFVKGRGSREKVKRIDSTQDRVYCFSWHESNVAGMPQEKPVLGYVYHEHSRDKMNPFLPRRL